jgi:hypothetical protein
MNLRPNKPSARGVRLPPNNVPVPSRFASAGRPLPKSKVMASDTSSHHGNTTTDSRRNTSLADAGPDGAFPNQNNVHGNIHTLVFIKDSWPVGRSVELDTYSTSSGQFGLPVLQ